MDNTSSEEEEGDSSSFSHSDSESEGGKGPRENGAGRGRGNGKLQRGRKASESKSPRGAPLKQTPAGKSRWIVSDSSSEGESEKKTEDGITKATAATTTTGNGEMGISSREALGVRVGRRTRPWR